MVARYHPTGVILYFAEQLDPEVERKLVAGLYALNNVYDVAGRPGSPADHPKCGHLIAIALAPGGGFLRDFAPVLEPYGLIDCQILGGPSSPHQGLIEIQEDKVYEETMKFLEAPALTEGTLAPTWIAMARARARIRAALNRSSDRRGNIVLA